MRMSCFVMLTVACSVFGSTVMADDWPQWRGPQRDGVSQEKGLLKEWPKEGPTLLWQVKDAGDGYSTPTVVGDRIYLLSNEGMENEMVQARRVQDGKLIWSTRIGNVGKPDQWPRYPAARSTPTVDGQYLYALGSDGDLACLQVETGELVWQQNIRTEFGGKSGTWAYSESPLIDGNKVVCTPGGAEATLLALNKKTGELNWKSAVPGGEDAGYASIIVVQVGGVKQYVQFLGQGLVGIDAETGKYLWRYDETGKGPANIPTPVAHQDFVYSASGRSGGGLVKLKVDGGSVEAEQVYFDQTLPKAIGGSVLVGDHLYGTTNQALLCVEFATGKEAWTDRSVGAGSICYADGHLYLHSEEKGEVALVEATPEGYREKGRFTPPDAPDRGGSRAWAYPVVANGRLYIRDIGALWCFDIKDASAVF